jgi:hypothetical protein
MQTTNHHFSKHRARHGSMIITLDGKLDASIAYDLARAFLNNDVDHIVISFKVRGHTKITDAGILLLMMFISRSNRMQIRVDLIFVFGSKVRFVSNPPPRYQFIQRLFTTKILSIKNAREPNSHVIHA